MTERGAAPAGHRSSPAAPALALLLLGATGPVPGCAPDDAADEVAAEGSGLEPLLPAPAPPSDVHGPAFDGVQSITLAGLDRFEIRWNPAVDDRTPPEQIRYRTYHVVEPYRELSNRTEAIHTSEPGATSVTIANDAPAGRFYVRAVDEAGNLSPITSGLMMRPERPRVSAEDGTVVSRITACADLPPGGGGPRAADAALGICVGEGGFAALWSARGWRMLDLGVVAAFRLAQTPVGLFAYTDVGHLFEIDPEGAAQLVDLVFVRRAPTLPLRQFTADTLGLRYWLDADGKVFVGAQREFLAMPRPLALPGTECRQLRGQTFGTAAAFAVCAEGLAYSVSMSSPGVPWTSLTPNADFVLPHGLNGVIAENDTEAILFDDLGVRRVGVGGWTPLLLVDWRQPGVHPMDIPESPPPISRIGQVFLREEGLRVVTDIGLMERAGVEWRVVPGTEGRLAGAIGGADTSQTTLVYEDGSVARASGGTRSWLVAPRVGDFAAGFALRDGTVLAFDRRGGAFRWSDAAWSRVAPAAPGGATPKRVVGLSPEQVYAISDAPGGLWRLDGAGWAQATFLYPGPPPRTSRAPVDDGFTIEPPPPLTGVAAGQSAAATPSPGVFVGLDVTGDGRGAAVTDHQVWWRLTNGWRHLTTRTGTLSGVALDAGETYVLIEDGQPLRCWRDQCGDPVPQPAAADGLITRTLDGSAGLVWITEGGEVLRYEPAALPAGAVLVDPAVETAVGGFVEGGPGLERYAAGASSLVRFGARWVLGTPGGDVLERVDDRWELQAEVDDLLAVLPVADGWGMLTHEGLFVLGDVAPVVRESE